jgi:hypothetical protein
MDSMRWAFTWARPGDVGEAAGAARPGWVLRDLRREFGLFAFFVALAVFHTGLWRAPAHRVGPSADTPPLVAGVDWVSRHLLTAPSRVFEYNVFFPYRDSGALFEPLLGPAVLVAPLTPFIANPILLFNCAVVLVLATMSYGAYRLGLRLLGDPALAILAALAVPYTGQQTGHYMHMNVVAACGFPFLMLGLVRLMERASVSAALLTGLALGLQAGTSGYHAISSAAMVAVVVLWRPRNLLRGKTLGLLLAALALAAAIVYPWASAFMSLQGPAGLARTVEQSRSAALGLRNYFASPSLVWRPVFGDDVDTAFPGAVVTILGVFGLIAARGRYAWLLRVAFATFVLMALGPDITIAGHRIPLPFGVVWSLVPVVRSCRHPITFVIPGLMAFVFLATMGVARLGWARRRWVLWLLGVLVVAETYAPPELVERELGLPPAYDRLRELPAGAFLEIPAGGWSEPEWQWRAIQHGLPVVNGWGPFVPRLQLDLYRLIKRQWSGRPARDLSGTRALEYLKRHFPIRYVLVHGDGWVARSIARTPSFVLEEECAPGDRIYRLIRSGRGPRIEREFRDDQLRGRVLTLRMRGTVGAMIVVHLNAQLLTTIVLTPAEAVWVLPVPAEALRRGRNAVRLEGTTAFEMADIDVTGES